MASICGRDTGGRQTEPGIREFQNSAQRDEYRLRRPFLVATHFRWVEFHSEHRQSEPLKYRLVQVSDCFVAVVICSIVASKSLVRCVLLQNWHLKFA